MKKAIIVAVMALTLTSAGLSLGFSLKLMGGAGYITGGDYNDGVAGMNDYLAAAKDNVTGTFSTIHFGMNFGAEFVLDLNEHLGLGLGLGYLRFSRDRQEVGYDWDFFMTTFHTTEFLQTTVTAIPITLNFHYKLPMDGFKLDFFAGVGYTLAKMKTDFGYDSDFLGMSSDVVFDSNSVGGKFGFQGGVGIEIPLGEKFSFIAGLTGRYTSLKDIQGDYAQSGTQLGLPYSASGKDAYFYSANFVFAGKSLRILDWVPDSNAPSGTAYSNARHATFGLTGVSAQAGIKVGF